MPIDMRSDTVTRPTPAMRRAMADAEVGDDVLDGDPTVRRLEARVAEMAGKEQGLFFPTGTMANQAAIAALTARGDEILVDADSHIMQREMGASAALSGVQHRAVAAADGALLDAPTLARLMRAPSRFAPRLSLACFENTHNGAGGRVTTLDALRALAAVARGRGLAVHLDGARLWNASVATGTPIADFAALADTVMLSFSKGLGAPVGALLAGPRHAIGDARVARSRFGGGMRQSGILAAAALHGIDVHLPRLSHDHARAAEFAQAVDGAGGARVVSPDTNIVMLDIPSEPGADAIASRAAELGLLVTAWTPTRLRAVTHLDVGDADVREAARLLRLVLEAASGH